MNDLIAARLDLIAAKARILSEQYKGNQLWDGQLSQQLNDIESEIASIRNSGNVGSQWPEARSGNWGPGDR